MFEIKEIAGVVFDEPMPTNPQFNVIDRDSLPKRSKVSIAVAGGDDLWIGLDSEWVRQGDRNLVLSYQVYCINSSGQALSLIYYPAPCTLHPANVTASRV